MDLCMSGLSKWSLTWSSSAKGTSSLLHAAFPSALWDLGLLKASHPSKDWGKGGFQYLSFFHALCNQVPVLLSSGPTLSIVFLLLPVYLQEPFFLSLTSLARFNFIWAIAFPLHLWMLRQCLCIPPRLPMFTSTLCMLPLHDSEWPGDPCSFTQVFLHRMDCSWALWRWSLTIDQFF